jgi:hypothetical protein
MSNRNVLLKLFVPRGRVEPGEPVAESRRFDENQRETISHEAWRETHHAATGTVALPRSLLFWAVIR